jgi:hypothetical protein
VDFYLQRLVVRGRSNEVAAFKEAAASRAKSAYGYWTGKELQTQRLSFLKLYRSLPPALTRNIGEPQEPWDLWVNRRRRHVDLTISITYGFQLSHSACDKLIIAISKVYPLLCFVLGTVAPNVDEQSSFFAHCGKASRWHLTDTRKNAILERLPEQTDDNEDEVSCGLDEADWEMMDEVIDHWDEKMREKMCLLTRNSRNTSK